MKHVRDFHSRSYNNPFFGPAGPSPWMVVFWLGGSLVVGGILFYAFIYSPLFRVGKIEVYGSTQIDPVKIKAAAMQSMAGYEYLIVPKDYYFVIDSMGLRNLLLIKYPMLMDAKVEKGFGTIKINIVDRQPTMRFIIGDKSYLLDQHGYAMREAAAGEGDKLVAIQNDTAIYAAGKQAVKPEWIKAVFDLHKYFATQVGVRDQLFKIDELNGVIMAVTTEGWYAVIDPLADINDQLKILSSALLGKFNSTDRNKLLYIDVRFGDKVFYKWPGKGHSKDGKQRSPED